MIPRPPKTTRTYTRFPDTTLFRSIRWHLLRAKCEDALALVSSVRDGILPIADVFGQGHCEEGFGRALDEEDHRSVRSAAERRHEAVRGIRSEEHTSELQSLMRISYAVFCLNKKKKTQEYRSTACHEDARI